VGPIAGDAGIRKGTPSESERTVRLTAASSFERLFLALDEPGELHELVTFDDAIWSQPSVVRSWR